MSLMRPLFLFALSCLITCLVEFNSFALAHSAAGILVVLVCPGILIIVFNLLTGAPGWAAAVAVNVAYYGLVWRLVLSKCQGNQRPRRP